MWSTALSALLVVYVPGAVVFRLPIAQRERRASLLPEERLFWSIVLSLALSSVVGFCLAAAGWYRFERLLLVNAVLSAVFIAATRTKLRLPSAAPPGWSAALAAGLTALAAAIIFSVPPAEYVMGGKDPGTYFNEGIQIAQRGTLTITDPLVAAMPPELRDLYMPDRGFETYDGSRFMGFYLVDADEGTVRGQFPHLFPLWIAIGYGAHGLTGARYVIGLLSVLGIMAVYFGGCWLLGRPAAAAGTILLTVNVASVWYSRYPNAEVMMQLLVFSGLLAFSRASVDRDAFFAPVAAMLLTLCFFAHLTGILVIGTVGVVALLSGYDRRTVQLSFLVPLVVGTTIAALYYSTLMAPYIERQLNFVLNRLPLIAVVGAPIMLGALMALAKTRAAEPIRRYLPWGVLLGAWLLAGYAYFVRVPGGTLSEYDADALRTFAQFYVSPLGVVAALVGLVVVGRRAFWRNLAFLATVIVFSCVFFYKMRIIPDHFWAARRFLAVVLPGTCLLIGAAAFSGSRLGPRALLDRTPIRTGLFAVGMIVTGLFAYHSFERTQPILRHVEYAGLIPQLERLDAELRESDLVLIESRQISDLQTLALPLAYIYARDVLVFWRRNPDKEAFREFLSWAKGRYRRVLYLGGSGTGLPSRSMTAVPLFLDRFEVPEYESAYRAYPTEVRQKAFEFGVYELLPRLSTPTEFDLDVGADDDLYVRQFYAKETMAGRDVTFRWSGEASSILLPAVDRENRSVTLWLNVGSRPQGAEPTRVDVYVNDSYLGAAAPTNLFEPFAFEIPLEVASEIEAGEDAALLRLDATTWTPSSVAGSDDARELGVMVDRITLD